MQLGMIGLGRMGANLTRRLMRDGHQMVVWNRDPAPTATLAAEGAVGAESPADLVAKLERPRAVWIMVPAAVTGKVVSDVAELLDEGDTIIDGGNSYYRDDIARAAELAPQGHPLRRRRHVRRRVRARPRLLPHDRRRGRGRRRGSTRSSPPSLPASRPPSERRAARASRRRPSRATCTAARNGAGHFVKMVHNGIEYGIMAAYAEGLDILRNADIGLRDRVDDAETAPLDHPEFYRYTIDTADVAEVWRRGSVVGSWLLDLTADGPARVARPRGLLGPRVRLRRGPVDVDRGDRGGHPGLRAHGRRLRAVQLARRGHVRQPRALGDAQAVRRPHRDARRRLS